jgi:iron complex outermembrane receptor protein
VGRTLRVPSFDELFLEQGLLAPNPDLRPEIGTGADAALAYESALGVASLGGHATTYDDLITYEPASFGRFKAFNTGRALAAGLEAEVATAPVRRLLGLSFQGAYTLLRTETLRGGPDEVGKALPRRPRHRLQARTAIAPGRFAAHVDARVVRDEWQNSLNTERVPDETVFSAGASVLLVRAPRLSLHVEVENLADVRSLQDGFGQPLPGRTLMVSLRAGTSQEGIP